MKILCSYSGIEFTCDHFPAKLYSRETCHPIFHIPQKKLLPYISKWAANELTQIDSYLLFLAALNTSELIQFRVPAIRTPSIDAIIANNMEYLFKTIIKLNTVTSPAAVFPQYVITPDTRTLENVHTWIENWEDAYKSFINGYKRAAENEKLKHREDALSRLIRNKHLPVSKYSVQIAEWAAIAGSFPVFNLKNPLNNNIIQCSEYWKIIIQKCAHEESIFAIPRKDIQELLEHCEEFVPMGSIYSFELFKILRHALEKQKNFLGLGDFDIKSASYHILTASDTTEDANMIALIDSAPAEMPRIEQYPSRFAFLKAKMRWDMARKHNKNAI